jgi:hypothetical protein
MNPNLLMKCMNVFFCDLKCMNVFLRLEMHEYQACDECSKRDIVWWTCVGLSQEDWSYNAI